MTLRRGDAGIELAVTDHGAGIAPQALPHVFDRFFQAEGSDRASGYGIGLSLVREIVEAHGGRVEVQSELGIGSTFRLMLPALAADAAAPLKRWSRRRSLRARRARVGKVGEPASAEPAATDERVEPEAMACDAGARWSWSSTTTTTCARASAACSRTATRPSRPPTAPARGTSRAIACRT